MNRFRGDPTPENILFDANLQVFANRVATICALENGGKITPYDAFLEIKGLWKQLKRSRKGLHIGEPPSDDDSFDLDDPAPPRP